MTTVFLSYSTHDHHFAELLQLKLAGENVEVWRDRGQLRVGTDWRLGIDQGIDASDAVLVALSDNSADSAYVTYEWAYAMGRNKPVLPLVLSACKAHPKLEPIQRLDFSVPGSLPWEELLTRIREIETDDDVSVRPATPQALSDADRETVPAILEYLKQRGYVMASFERIRRRINEGLTDEQLGALVDRNPTLFRRAILNGNRPGLARRTS